MIRYLLSISVILLLGALTSACTVDMEPDSTTSVEQSHLSAGDSGDPFGIAVGFGAALTVI